jgi:ubiquinone/menaquinone biosynthesis C-methylase UbiE
MHRTVKKRHTPHASPARTNRAYWDETSDAYQQMHGEILERTPLAWGVWRIPESELAVLGDIRDRDVLELGCGAAQWTFELARCGARAVGVDLSARQLAHAREHRERCASPTHLVQADAEKLPFAGESFDVVFCDHGATSFARPSETVAEASRVLRRGGLFAFCISTPLRDICWDPQTDTTTSRLTEDYFTLGELRDDTSVCYQLPYGEWIRLFRCHSLIVEDLIELRPPPDAATTYAGYVPLEWARRWPAENIWKLRKATS